MRPARLLLLLSACGSSAPRQPALQPTLTEDPPPSVIDAGPTMEEVGILADRQCIVSGAFAVTVDQTAAEITSTGKTPRERCIELASQVARHQTLTIENLASELRLDWNGPQKTVIVDGCEFEIHSPTIEADVWFRNQKGHGKANLDLGEACVAKGVVFELVRPPGT